MESASNKKRTLIYNIIFLIAGGAILLFLLNAPPESTSKIPYDDIHSKYYPMGKKEAEKECESCHNPEGMAPMPQGHPPKYRCLFCHKKKNQDER